MKNILILLFIAVLLAAYFILQDDGSMVAPQPDMASPDITDEHVPVEESHGTVLVEDDKTSPVQSMPNKDGALEPEIRDAVREHVNTSQEGLVEEKTDKGVEMKLNGRFRTAPVATIDEKGEVTVRDYTAPPAE